MALTYEKVINVISQRPDQRKDFEVNNLLPWFRKKSQLFANLKSELLFDIIKNLQFVSKDRDDIIIKQGEKGDCMYILLRGEVTIYILYTAKGEGEEDKTNQPQVTAKAGSEALRQQLGTFVTNLGAGATFGEVALMSDDCIRTASIICNEPTDLIVVDRELYNRSVKNVLKKEFEDKSNFITSNPYFKAWPPKYKKQLAMALQIETVPYEGIVTKQGEPLEAIYYVLRGELKVVVDPQLHKTQYRKLFDKEDTAEKTKSTPTEDEDEDVLRTVSGTRERSESDPSSLHKLRRKSMKKHPLEICLLGVNESVGDIEVFLDLDTYMQTAICTQRTEVLVLEMKHYERLLVKRNPRTIEFMKEDLELRLKSRLHRHLERSVPLLRCLFLKAQEYNVQRRQQNEARYNAIQERHVKQPKTIGDSYDSFVPPHGALIDLYGPGTVFHRIREREAAKIKKQERLRNKNAYSGFRGMATPGGLSRGQGQGRDDDDGGTTLGGASREPGSSSDQRPDHLTSDPVLTNLENRMRAWLANEYSAQNPNTPGSTKSQPRVAKLHRGSAEADRIKPGVKVIIRRKDQFVQPEESSQFNNNAQEQTIQNGGSWRKPGHYYYRKSRSSLA